MTSTSRQLRIIALISAHNEGDVIRHVIGDLVQQGVEVYLINHCSTDNTVAEASKWLGRGLLRIENFPEDAGYSSRNATEYLWSDLLRRKEELAQLLDADWFIHHDADEFRESPWPALDLYAAICLVDSKGYSAIDFELLNFRPVDDSFVAGSDVRTALQYYEEAGSTMGPQIKCWKKLGGPVDLASSGGHDVQFEGRVLCPVKFILRHYPIRSQAHGVRKVLAERKKRYNAREKRVFGWHTHYDSIEGVEHLFLYHSEHLKKYDPVAFRQRLLSSYSCPMAPAGAELVQARVRQGQFEKAATPRNDQAVERGVGPSFRLKQEALFCYHDLLNLADHALSKLKKFFRSSF